MRMRAYTRIDAGNAVLGNAWLERTWSTFLGHTVGIQVSGGVEWFPRRAHECGFMVSGLRHELMDLGDKEWSEECDAFGAVLDLSQSGGKLHAHTRTRAFHDIAAMLRGTQILWNGESPALLDSAALDGIGMPIALAEPLHAGANAEVGDAVVLGIEGRRIILGALGPVTIAAETGGASAVVSMRGALEVEAGRWLRLPETYVIACMSTDMEELRREHEAFMAHLGRFREWQHCRAALEAEATD